MNELDTFPDGYYWGITKRFGVARMLQKHTERNTYGQPWKDIEAGRRVTWSEIKTRYSELVKIEPPKMAE